jgi:replicative DNA helicase
VIHRANAHVEAWVLGALLDAEGPVLRSRTRELLDATGLVAADFTTSRHATAFGAIRQLVDSGRQADAQTVWAVCRGLPGFDDPAQGQLAQLQASNECNREALLTHAVELRRLRLLRELAAFLAAQGAHLDKPRADPVALGAALEAFAATFAATTQEDQTGEPDAIEVLERWDAVNRGDREAYLRTGIRVLDEALGGFVPNLNVIGGAPSVGKSALIGEVIMACLERGLRVGLFGLEDATVWLTKRHLSRAMGIPVSAVCAVPLNRAQQENLQEQAGVITQWTQHLLVYRRAGIDPATLIARCKHWVLNRGVQAVFIDHGGEVQHDISDRKRYDLAVAATYRQLRDLAVNQRVPIVVLAHFNQDTERQGGVPTMTSFAESAYIARMARVALGLWEKPGDSRLRCTVIKRTEGERGITVGLERDVEHALVKRDGGGVIDLGREQELDRQAARARAKGKAWQMPLPTES